MLARSFPVAVVEVSGPASCAIARTTSRSVCVGPSAAAIRRDEERERDRRNVACSHEIRSRLSSWCAPCRAYRGRLGGRHPHRDSMADWSRRQSVVRSSPRPAGEAETLATFEEHWPPPIPTQPACGRPKPYLKQHQRSSDESPAGDARPCDVSSSRRPARFAMN